MNYEESKKLKKKMLSAIDEPIDLSEDIGEDEDELDCEAFSAGTHTDSTGDTATWTKDDLQKIATTYNEKSAIQPAPVCIGHPLDNSPAFGWIKKAYVEGDKLKLKLHQLNKNFVDCLRNHAYKNRSISMYDDGTIRHVAFLGAMQPAVKGLAPLQFNEHGSYKTYSFSEEKTMADVIDKVDVEEIKKENQFFNRLLKKFGFDVAKAKMEFAEFAKPNVEALEGGTAVKEKESTSESENAETIDTETKDAKVAPASITVDKEAQAKDKEESGKISQENEALKGEVAALKSEVEALRKQVTEQVASKAASDKKSFCEGLVRDGKLRPADLEESIKNLEAREYIDSLHTTRSFSEGKPSKSSVETYMDYLAAQPKIIEFGEVPNEPRSDAAVAFPSSSFEVENYIAKKVAEAQRLNPAISYEEATKCAYSECEKGAPEAYAEYMKACYGK
jgi:hypothetical protein